MKNRKVQVWLEALLVITILAAFGISIYRPIKFSTKVRELASEQVGQNHIAVLRAYFPEVIFRRQSDTNWDDVSQPNLFFFENDAVQTKVRASAEIELINGSQINMAEETLIVFDLEFLKKLSLHDVDHLSLQVGKIRATTRKNLWISTPHRLVKIKKSNKTEVASISLDVQPTKTTELKLESGEGEVIKEPFTPQETILPLTIESPVLLEEEKEQENKDKEEKQEKEDAVELSAPLLHIDFPPDRIEVYEPQISIRGKVARSQLLGLYINGRKQRVTKDGRFKVAFDLNPGLNRIIIQAVAGNGRSKTEKLQVTRQNR